MQTHLKKTVNTLNIDTRGDQMITSRVNLIKYLMRIHSDCINECCIRIREILHIL